MTKKDITNFERRLNERWKPHPFIESIKELYGTYVPYVQKRDTPSFSRKASTEQVWIIKDPMKREGYSVLIGEFPHSGYNGKMATLAGDKTLNRLGLACLND